MPPPSHYDKRNIERDTLNNAYFRRVLYTARNLQLVVMSLRPGQDIGMERHAKTDQFIRVEGGRGVAHLGRSKRAGTLDSRRLKDGDSLTVDAGTWHNVTNTHPTEPLKLYTVYSRPEHAPDCRQRRKEHDAEC